MIIIRADRITSAARRRRGPRVPLLLLNHLFFIASSITIAFSYPLLAPYVYAH